MKDLTTLNKYRDFVFEQKMYGLLTDVERSRVGAFYIPTKGSKRGMKVIASSGEIATSRGWDHVSISLQNRCPDWGEMCKIKSLFFEPEDVCFQLHPAESDNISNHGTCLHIWRNIHTPIPLPPSDMVGIKDMGDMTKKHVSAEEVRELQTQIVRTLIPVQTDISRKLSNQSLYGSFSKN